MMSKNMNVTKQEMDDVVMYLKEAGYKVNVITKIDEWEMYFKISN